LATSAEYVAPLYSKQNCHRFSVIKSSIRLALVGTGNFSDAILSRIPLWNVIALQSPLKCISINQTIL